MIDVGLTLRQLAQPLRKAPPPAPSQTQPPPAAAAGAAAAGAAGSSSRPSRSRRRRSSRSSRSRRRRRGRSRSRRRRKRDDEDTDGVGGDAAGDGAVVAAELSAEEPLPEAAEESPPHGADGGVDEAEVAADLLALQDVKEEIHSPAEDGVHEVGEPARARQKGLQRPPLPFLPFGLLPPGTVVVPQAVPPGRVTAPTSPPTMPQRTQRVPAPPKTRPPGYSAPTTPKRRVPVDLVLERMMAASSGAPDHTEPAEADPPWRANWRSRGRSHDDSELNDEDVWPSWKTY